jgi:hypothetical protein
MAEQIFISHSSADNACVERLYDHLIDERYWVWMDKKDLRGGEKWEPQIDENLRKASIFLVLFSPTSLKSPWVWHEGSMAFALNQRIVPVNIEPGQSYLIKDLPLWTQPIQLLDLFDGLPQYGDQLQLLKQRLGTPIPIRQFLLQSLEHYKRDGVLLDEVSLALVERHYDALHLMGSQRRIADELIQESKFKLEAYWIRYNKLNKAYKQARDEGLEVKQVVRDLHRAKVLRELLTGVAILGVVAMIGIEIFRAYLSFRLGWRP